jgi:hypothetical protein
MEITQQINATEEELNFLFKETLDGLRDDLTEANENVSLYLGAIEKDPGGKELYGTLYNDSLRIKGAARDRFLKFLALIKDRVSKKEDAAAKNKNTDDTSFSFNHVDLNSFVAKLKNKEAENNEEDDDTFEEFRDEEEN